MHKKTDKKFIYEKMPERIENSNKATFGKVLNIAGSFMYPGAAYLSSLSSLKIGAGYVTLACPDIILPFIAIKSPEITFKPLKSKNGVIAKENEILDFSKYNVISIGCGLTNTEETQEFFYNIIKEINPEQKIIIDADGINILAAKKETILLKNTIITPHPKELSRLLRVDIEEILSNREKYARIASQTYDCVTVLKGHNSIITDGDNVYINQTGSSALAKAGTGDVLTGILSGLAAQGMPVLDAAIAGTYLHGLSADIAAEELTQYCVLASDVIDYLPCAIDEIMQQE